MARIISTALVTGLLLVAAVSFGASAFTSATVDRNANIDVVADENGLLALTDGNSGNLVFQDASTEQLGIDFTNGTAAGANVNATFELGNPADPVNSNAFNVENRDDEQHQINVAYTGATTNTEENLNISIYDNTGTLLDSATEEGTTASFTAPAGNTFHVVLTVDTGLGAAPTDLTSASDLSGTISFTIDDVNEGGTNSDGS
jgi:hypothetical protein